MIMIVPPPLDNPPLPLCRPAAGPLQVALLVILAQVGCYVPASFMSLSPYDSLHTRVGVCDSIESNASSFMVEMADMAHLMDRCVAGRGGVSLSGGGRVVYIWGGMFDTHVQTLSMGRGRGVLGRGTIHGRVCGLREGAPRGPSWKVKGEDGC